MSAEVVPGSVSIGFIHPGDVKATFMTSMVQLTLWDVSNQARMFTHDRFWLQGHFGSGGLVKGRNEIAAGMLDKSNAEWLFWIDTDMAFDAEIVDQLVECADPVERPVVGALCFAQRNDGAGPCGTRYFRTQPTIYRWFEDEGEAGMVPWFDYPRDEIVRCDGTGSAAVLIHRDVLQRMRDIFGDDWYTPIKHKFGNVFSEDLSFCMRLMTMHVPLYVNTAVKTVHDKGSIYLHEEQYDRERAERQHRGDVGSDVDPTQLYMPES